MPRPSSLHAQVGNEIEINFNSTTARGVLIRVLETQMIQESEIEIVGQTTMPVSDVADEGLRIEVPFMAPPPHKRRF